MTSLTESLRPCPFCGGKPFVLKKFGDARYLCDNCGFDVTEATWNTRTALEQPTNDVERVRERWRRIGDEWDRAKEAALTQKNEGDL